MNIRKGPSNCQCVIRGLMFGTSYPINSFSLSAKYSGTFSNPLSCCRLRVDKRTAISG